VALSPPPRWTSAVPCRKSLAKEKGAEVTDAMMEEFKTLVHGSSDAARQRDPARSGMGVALLQAPRQERRSSAGV